jgi:hypothetical protein
VQAQYGSTRSCTRSWVLVADEAASKLSVTPRAAACTQVATVVSKEKPGPKDNAKHPKWASNKCAVSLVEAGTNADVAVELLCAGLARLPKLKRVRDPAAREAITALASECLLARTHPHLHLLGRAGVPGAGRRAADVVTMVCCCHAVTPHPPVLHLAQALRTRPRRRGAGCLCMATPVTARTRSPLHPSLLHGASPARRRHCNALPEVPRGRSRDE